MPTEGVYRVEIVRPPSVGGQHAGSPNYPIRVTHIPTGLVAECGFERSQHKNRKIAFEMIAWALVNLGMEVDRDD